MGIADMLSKGTANGFLGWHGYFVSVVYQLDNFYSVKIWKEGQRATKLEEDWTESEVCNLDIDDPKSS